MRTPPEARSLSQKLIVSGTLATAEHAISILLRLGSTLILTRILSPEIYGVMAVIATFQVLVVMLSDFGIRSLIIVSDNVDDPTFLRTCWSVQLLRGTVLWCVVLALSALLYCLQQAQLTGADTAYSHPLLSAALAVSGLSLFLQGVESVNQHVYARNLRFGRITVMTLAAAATVPLVAVLLALVEPSIWVLVIAGLVGSLVRAALSFWLFPGVSTWFAWNHTYLAELIGRGKWIMASSALTVATRSADQLVLAAFAPSQVVGIYFLAKQISSVPENFLHKLHANSGLQMFTNIVTGTDVGSFRQRYYRYRLPIDFISGIFSGVFAVTGPTLIRLLYDARYEFAGQIIQILAIGLLFFGPALIRDAYGALKRFDVVTFVTLIEATTIWTTLVVSFLVFNNIYIGLFCIAVYKLPALLYLLTISRSRSWIIFIKESIIFLFIGLGALLGWAFVNAIEGIGL